MVGLVALGDGAVSVFGCTGPAPSVPCHCLAKVTLSGGVSVWINEECLYELLYASASTIFEVVTFQIISLRNITKRKSNSPGNAVKLVGIS